MAVDGTLLPGQEVGFSRADRVHWLNFLYGGLFYPLLLCLPCKLALLILDFLKVVRRL